MCSLAVAMAVELRYDDDTHQQCPLAMPTYRLSLHDSVSVERIGAITLTNDAEATAFAVRVIRDIKTWATGSYDGWIMDITEGDRDAGRITFDSVQP
jgi:hypothetical protein